MCAVCLKVDTEMRVVSRWIWFATMQVTVLRVKCSSFNWRQSAILETDTSKFWELIRPFGNFPNASNRAKLISV